MKHDGINFPLNQSLITIKNKVFALVQTKRKPLQRNQFKYIQVCICHLNDNNEKIISTSDCNTSQ